MRRRRLILALIVAAGLAPGLWLQDLTPTPDNSQQLSVISLPVGSVRTGPFSVEGAWRLASSNSWFGGFSALASLGDGRLLAATDRGGMVIFSPPGSKPAPPLITSFARFDTLAEGFGDLESLTRDAGSGRLWAGYEVDSKILRVEARFGGGRRINPVPMRGWRANGGPEAMARLPDGRFIVIAETGLRRLDPVRPAVLFASDPVGRPPYTRFSYVPPDGYAPTDMAALPDGRVLILLRAFKFVPPWGFVGKLAIADPARIRAGGQWTSQVLADLGPPLPRDNFEGLALEPRPDGGVDIWIVTDDNHSPLQRTLLLKLTWPAASARRAGTVRRPSRPS